MSEEPITNGITELTVVSSIVHTGGTHGARVGDLVKKACKVKGANGADGANHEQRSTKFKGQMKSFLSKLVKNQGTILFGLIVLMVQLLHQFREEGNPSQIEVSWLDLIASIIAYSYAIASYASVIYRILRLAPSVDSQDQSEGRTTSSYIKMMCLVAGTSILSCRCLDMYDRFSMQEYRRACRTIFVIVFNIVQMTFVAIFLLKEKATVAMFNNNSWTKHVFPRVAMGVSIFTVLRTMLCTCRTTLTNIPYYSEDNNGYLNTTILKMIQEPSYNCGVVFEILNCCFVFAIAQNVRTTIGQYTKISDRDILLVRGCQFVVPILAVILSVTIRCVPGIPTYSTIFTCLQVTVLAVGTLASYSEIRFMKVVLTRVNSSTSPPQSSPNFYRTLINYLGLAVETLFSCVGILTYVRSWKSDLFSNVFFATSIFRLFQSGLQSTIILMACTPFTEERTPENGSKNVMEYKPNQRTLRILLVVNSLSLIFNFMDSQLASMPGDITVETRYNNAYWALLVRTFTPLVVFYRIISIDQLSEILAHRCECSDPTNSKTNQEFKGISAVLKQNALWNLRYNLWTNVCSVIFITMLDLTIANEIYGIINTFYPAKGQHPNNMWDDFVFLVYAVASIIIVCIRLRSSTASLNPEDTVLASSAAGNLFLLIGLAIFGSVGVVQYASTSVYCMVVPPFMDFIRNKLSDECDIMSVCSNMVIAIFLILQVTLYFCNDKSIFVEKKSFISQFFLMFVYATNFSMWIRHVVFEGIQTAKHINDNHMNDSLHPCAHHMNDSLWEDEHLKTGNSSYTYDMNSIFKGFEGPMWTCVVEYSMIAAAIGSILHRRLKKVSKTTFDREIKMKSTFSVDWLSMSKAKWTIFIVFFFVCFTCFLLTLVLLTNTNKIIEDMIFNIGAVIVIYAGLFICLSVINLSEGEFADNHDDVALDKILLYVGFVGSMIWCAGSLTSSIENESYGLWWLIIFDVARMLELVLQFQIILNWWEKIHCVDAHMLRMKTLMLLNVCYFVFAVLYANVSGPNADSLKSTSSNNKWIVFVRVTIFFIVFFRFHSSICLAEIWIEAKQHQRKQCNPNHDVANLEESLDNLNNTIIPVNDAVNTARTTISLATTEKELEDAKEAILVQLDKLPNRVEHGIRNFEDALNMVMEEKRISLERAYSRDADAVDERNEQMDPSVD